LELFYSPEAKYQENRGGISEDRPNSYINIIKDNYSPLRKRSNSPVKFTKSYEKSFSPASTKASPTITGDFGSPLKRSHFDERFESPKSPNEQFSNITFKPYEFSTPTKTLNFKDRTELAELLGEIIHHMHRLEDVKNELALRRDFNLFNAFAIFDIEKKGWINKSQLQKGLRKLEIFPNQDEIYLLMKRLDVDVDGQVR